MIDETNPFIRGYQALSIRRLLIVSYDDECPLTYLPLHSSQAHLADLEVTPQPCMFCEDFVFLPRGRPIPDDVDALTQFLRAPDEALLDVNVRRARLSFSLDGLPAAIDESFGAMGWRAW